MKFSGCLIASDYDGTLYNNEGVVTPQVREKIAYFIANGGKFTVCTGRTVQGFHAYESSYINAPVLHGNGSTCYDYETSTLVFGDSVGEEIFDALRSVAKEFPEAAIEMYGFYDSFVINNCETSHKHFTVQDIKYSVINDPSESQTPWQKVMIYSENDSVKIQTFLQKNHPEVHFLPTTGTYIEIMKPGVDKGSGLLKLADSLGIDHSKVFAVGDGFNDKEMLVAAAMGFVPCNGSEEALAVADRVVRSNNDGAVAHVIEILDEMF